MLGEKGGILWGGEGGGFFVQVYARESGGWVGRSLA